jgi:threonyl-tRNA synthetase
VQLSVERVLVCIIVSVCRYPDSVSDSCTPCQVDFNLPERFNLSYNDSDQQKRRPIMIHRAIFGSLERFFGVLTENYAGDFPLWLAPVQVKP